RVEEECAELSARALRLLVVVERDAEGEARLGFAGEVALEVVAAVREGTERLDLHAPRVREAGVAGLDRPSLAARHGRGEDDRPAVAPPGVGGPEPHVAIRSEGAVHDG